MVRGLRTEEKTRLIAHGVVIMYAFDKCQFFEAGCAAIRMRTRHSPFSDKLLKLVKTFCATYVEFVLFFWLVGGFSFFGNGPMYYIIERLKFKLLISVRDFPSNKAVEDDVKRAISSYLLSKWWICKYLCIYISMKHKANLNECRWWGGITAGADCTFWLLIFLVSCVISNLGSSGGWHGSFFSVSEGFWEWCLALKSLKTRVFWR